MISDIIYPHLGRLHGQHLRVSKELDCRIVKAAAAFREKKAVLLSSQLPVQTRLQLLRTYVVCHLLQNQATSPVLTSAEYQKLRGAYLGFVRAVVGEKSTSHRKSALSDEQNKTQLPEATSSGRFCASEGTLGSIVRFVIVLDRHIQFIETIASCEVACVE
eukprot:679057-Amphidinium_carterae.1